MDINKTDIRYSLTTSDGCGGFGLISKPDSFAWGHGIEGQGEPVAVLFEQIEEDGSVSDSCEIDGDDWSTLEESGELEKMLVWVRRGCTLESAVAAVVQEVDPDGFDGAYEDRIDDLIFERDAMRDALAAAAAYVELFTANGTTKQPPAWAVLGNGEFNAEEIANRARVALGDKT